MPLAQIARPTRFCFPAGPLSLPLSQPSTPRPHLSASSPTSRPSPSSMAAGHRAFHGAVSPLPRLLTAPRATHQCAVPRAPPRTLPLPETDAPTEPPPLIVPPVHTAASTPFPCPLSALYKSTSTPSSSRASPALSRLHSATAPISFDGASSSVPNSQVSSSFSPLHFIAFPVANGAREAPIGHRRRARTRRHRPPPPAHLRATTTV
jgi:hypothetical protein